MHIIEPNIVKMAKEQLENKEPTKYVLHVAEADPMEVCLLGVAFGNERLKTLAIYNSNDVWDVVATSISINKSVEISQPMAKDFAESMAVEVAKFAARGLMLCGCGKGVVFKLVEMDGE